VLASFVQFSEVIFVTILGGVGMELERAGSDVSGGNRESLDVKEQLDFEVLI